MQKHISISTLEMPKSGAGLKSILNNYSYSRRNRSCVNHITGHINYVSLATGRRTILTVHDIGSALKGNSIHRLLIKLVWFWLPALMVKKITVISDFSKMELSKLIPFAKNKIAVIHNPVNSALQYSPKDLKGSNPLVLHIGTKSNKNLERTIKALETIKCRLLVIGALSEEQVELLKECKIDYTNRKYIPFLEIKAAYEECDLVSFVSLYEGFGMPVIEAQAVGRPVLASAIEPITEVAGGAACFVNPYNVDEIRQGVLKIINDEDFRNNLVLKGQENVKRFQLREIADQYLELYKEVANA